MKFAQVIGQQKLKEQLITQVQKGRIAHAQLFSGGEGSGHFALAQAYITYLNCTQRSPTDSCGLCPSCKKMNRLEHSDIYYIFPYAKNSQTTISTHYLDSWREMVSNNPYFSFENWVDQLQEEKKQLTITSKEAEYISEQSLYKIVEDGYRAFIIWQPEKMHTTCVNKLLKLLEEPPSKTIFLLVSEHGNELLPTVYSRMLHIQVPPLSTDEIAFGLQHHYTDKEMVAYNSVAHMAQGNWLRAMQMIDSNTSNNQLDYFIKLMRVSYTKDVSGMMQWSEELSQQSRDRQKKFIQYALTLIREGYIMHYNTPQINYISPAEKAFLINFHPYVSHENVADMRDNWEKAHQYISLNGNGKIIFMDLALETTKQIWRVKNQLKRNA